MTFEIALVLLILGASLVLFITEIVRMDLVALLVLAALALTRLVSPADALAGFSNPAVITVWAMFILSAGLSRAGVAEIVGHHLLGWIGRGETRMITVVMLTAAVLSAFMNNIGVAALMLPVVLDVARRTGTPPSRLLMPLAYGSLLGGLTTLIGTPPNLLVAESLHNEGLQPFGLFDYTPVGAVAMVAGIGFVALIGRRLLPQRDPGREASSMGPAELPQQYRLDERTAVVRLSPDSELAGKTLLDSRVGAATGLNVYAILRNGQPLLAPGPETELHADDRLLVEGRLDRFNQMRAWKHLTIDEESPDLDALVSTEIGLGELCVAGGASIAGQTIGQIGFRNRFGVIVLALRRSSGTTHRGLASIALRRGDRLLVQGRTEDLDALRDGTEFEASQPLEEIDETYGLRERLFAVQVPGDSALEGHSLAESRIGDALGFGVLGLVRAGETRLLPSSDERIEAGDVLLARGSRDDVDIFRGLQGLQIENETAPELRELDPEGAGLIEAMLSPRASLVGKTPSEVGFRERYGMRILAVLREGRIQRSNLRSVRLRFGDALLLLGPREKVQILRTDPDFLVLTAAEERVIDRSKAPLATLIAAGVIGPVLLGWVPISIAAVTGAALMILVGCLTADEAYSSIEWKSIFLIAGMLPLGTAMQQTGAASFLAEGILALGTRFGGWGVLVGIYLLTALATAIIPTAALVVLMAPIAYKACAETGLSPYAVMMAVAMAASASFTSPVSHPANVLVMGPGGYRFVDYVKVGVPLTLVILVVVLLVLPLIWPLYG